MITEETSKRITSLRFPLAVLVVCIHNNFTAESIAESVQKGAAPMLFVQSEFGVWVQRLLSSGIAVCAVPLFFLFAAYLFEKKGDSFSVMLAKKSRSLLLPYAAWFAVGVLYYGPLKLLAARFLPSLLATPEKTIFSQTAADWAEFAVGFRLGSAADKQGMPLFAIQFWFVRDLMILMLFSPLLVRAAKRFPTAVVFLASLFYVCGNIPADDHAPTALFFFTAGIFWAEYDIDLFGSIDKVKWSEALFAFVLSFVFCHADVFGADAGASRFFDCSLTIASCVLALKCSQAIAGNNRWFAFASRLSKYSFFLYAVHIPVVLGVVQKVWLMLFPMKNAFFCLAEYLFVSALTVLIGTALGAVLKKICPPVFAVFNGGRG
ncbi:MAG: acyltransferase [Bacteroides sp.]|nr:acyltransferase [Prevotella sp.]MCM1406870.1 acyltransferase [Treponema brennaborense]MCM1470893.1 acyltransferase [Bacteroides sp.]